MPASRSAAATTLAPRSCPSRPGFPTRTRILRCMVSPGWIAARDRPRARRKYTNRGASVQPSMQRPGAFAVAERQQPDGLGVTPARLLELLGGRQDRTLVLAARVHHHRALLEQLERGVGSLFHLEAVAHVLAVATQQLQPPRV